MKKSQKNTRHGFDIDVASDYGIVPAILISYFQFWIEKNIDEERNFYDGRYWVYFSVSTLAKRFKYLSEKQVRIAIDKLYKKDVIVKSNYNKMPYDRTTWYAFKNEDFWIENWRKRKAKDTK